MQGALSDSCSQKFGTLISKTEKVSCFQSTGFHGVNLQAGVLDVTHTPRALFQQNKCL